jgi:hypothetical protein
MKLTFVSDGYWRARRGIEQARETMAVTVREEYAERLAEASPAERAELELEILAVIKARLKPPSPSAFY